MVLLGLASWAIILGLIGLGGIVVAIILFIIYKATKRRPIFLILPIITTVISVVLIMPIVLLGGMANEINEDDKEIYGTMYFNASYENWEIVEKLIKEGEDPDGTYEITPLMEACMQQNLEAIEFLVDNGAAVNAMDHEDTTPLIYALWGEDLDKQFAVVSLLIENEADVNIRCNYDHNTPLMSACENHCSVSIVRLLIETGADVNLIDLSNRTALIYVFFDYWEMFDADVVELLIENGADKSIVDDEGMTALDYLIEHYNDEEEFLSAEKDEYQDEYEYVFELFDSPMPD